MLDILYIDLVYLLHR